MNKKYFGCIALALTLMFSFSVFAVNPPADKTVAKTASSADKTEVLKARFLNMLNHNFAYNDAFNSVEELANCAVTAQLGKRDSTDDSYISEQYVKDYMIDMYGIAPDDFSAINAEFPQKPGYVYIIPRGFSIYRHSNAAVTLNEDGTYTVTTDVSVSSHDGESQNGKAVSLFVKNSDSHFGFYILSSNFYFNADNT